MAIGANLHNLEESDGESVLVPAVPYAFPYQYEPGHVRPVTPALRDETDSKASSGSDSKEDTNNRFEMQNGK